VTLIRIGGRRDPAFDCSFLYTRTAIRSLLYVLKQDLFEKPSRLLYLRDRAIGGCHEFAGVGNQAGKERFASHLVGPVYIRASFYTRSTQPIQTVVMKECRKPFPLLFGHHPRQLKHGSRQQIVCILDCPTTQDRLGIQGRFDLIALEQPALSRLIKAALKKQAVLLM
jgi:hypothetical protein